MAMDFETFKQGLCELAAKSNQLNELESIPELADSFQVIKNVFPAVAGAKILQLLADYMGVSVDDVRTASGK